ncbi:MAG: hypothetical protein AAGD14_00770 [Planctomycetota bacterium]
MRWTCTLLFVVACSAPPPAADLGDLYTRAAQHHGPERNPVIVIPGILGSRLVAGDQVVWGAFGGGSADPKKPADARLLALPMNDPNAEDGVRVDGALDRVRLNVLGLPVQLSAYAQILQTLGAGGYRDQQLAQAGAVDYGDDHFTCFQFAYDWRRDNIENARRLHEFIVEKKAFVTKELEKRYGKLDKEVRFDIVAHSMGGLVTRYYMRYGTAEPGGPITWAGTQHVERAFLVGTPNAGSAAAVHQLVRGTQLAPILPKYPPALLGTYPSIYQLMPRTRHGSTVAGDERVDVFDPQVWIDRGWGLADPNESGTLEKLLPDVSAEERRTRALAHQRWCLERAKAFHAALDVKAAPPPNASLYLFAGDAVQTPAVFDAEARDFTTYAPGDGTVTRSSALMDERIGRAWMPMLESPITWRQVVFLFRDHIGLTKDAQFADNVLYLLLEAPR